LEEEANRFKKTAEDVTKENVALKGQVDALQKELKELKEKNAQNNNPSRSDSTLHSVENTNVKPKTSTSTSNTKTKLPSKTTTTTKSKSMTTTLGHCLSSSHSPTHHCIFIFV
jgi:predicted  nucleic acid-binding Zn-ribbon protein